MNLLGIPVILGLRKAKSDAKAYLERLNDEAQVYVDMLEDYKYIKAKNMTGHPESKDMQFPDDMGIAFSLNIFGGYEEDTTSGQVFDNLKNVIIKDPLATAKILIINNSEHTYTIEGIDPKFYILGGEENKKQYPFQFCHYVEAKDVDKSISDFESWLYTMMEGKVKIPYESVYISPYEVRGEVRSMVNPDAFTIKPGAVRVFEIREYFEVLDVDSKNYCTPQYLEFLDQMRYLKEGAMMDITLFWKSDNKDNPGGRFVENGIKGSVTRNELV